MDGTADTVVQLHIELGQNVSCRVEKGTDEYKPPRSKYKKRQLLLTNGVENMANKLTVKDAGLCDVSHCSRLHYVPDDELLDGLVLRDTAGTVGAADGLDMATALLSTTVIPPLLGL